LPPKSSGFKTNESANCSDKFYFVLLNVYPLKLQNYYYLFNFVAVNFNKIILHSITVLAVVTMIAYRTEKESRNNS